MYKQVFDKNNGNPKLIENDEFDASVYTDVAPEDGLYRPIYFDGNEWIGTQYEDWKKNQPEIEDEIIIDEKDEIIADLSVQLLEAQSSIKNIEKDVANLSIMILEGDTDA